MNDNEFYIKAWKYSCISICVLVLSVVGSCQNTKYTILQMVESGASPIEASCALELQNTRADRLCFLVQEK